MTVTIAIDVMGGDHGAKVTVPATLSFLKRNPDVHIILVGNQSLIQQALAEHKADAHGQITIQHASEVVEMDESPQSALKNKKRFFYASGD